MSSRKELANAIRAEHGCCTESQIRPPGAPMGMADIAEVLWRDFMNHNPQNLPGPTATALCCPTATVPC